MMQSATMPPYLIGQPEAPTVFIPFLDRQVKQLMNSAFLVFDLVGGDAGFQCERDARRSIHPKFDHLEEAVGLIVGKES